MYQDPRLWVLSRIGSVGVVFVLVFKNDNEALPLLARLQGTNKTLNPSNRAPLQQRHRVQEPTKYSTLLVLEENN